MFQFYRGFWGEKHGKINGFLKFRFFMVTGPLQNWRFFAIFEVQLGPVELWCSTDLIFLWLMFYRFTSFWLSPFWLFMMKNNLFSKYFITFEDWTQLHRYFTPINTTLYYTTNTHYQIIRLFWTVICRLETKFLDWKEDYVIGNETCTFETVNLDWKQKWTLQTKFVSYKQMRLETYIIIRKHL